MRLPSWLTYGTGTLSVACAVAVVACKAHGTQGANAHRSLASACPEGMKLLPAARFIVGDRYDTGAVEAFCMDVTEVTVAAYAGCTAANVCSEPDPYLPDDNDKLRRACNWKRPGAEHHPVNCIDWQQASAYCNWAGKRLPTEEEWEWAARGEAEARLYPWGNDAPGPTRLNACDDRCVAWGLENANKQWQEMFAGDDGWPTTAPVGSYPKGATAQGLLDMSGNVWEWTSSNYDGKAKVTRGGGWADFKATRVRAAQRSGDAPTVRTRSLGFRCAG
jgi:formylglycine-generating enzyme required for sulfatase activity